MANNIHKGSEFNNVNETWDLNEQKRQKGTAPANEGMQTRGKRNDLERVIKEEATEYDNVNKEDRVLSGDRATINDEPAKSDSEE